MVKFPGNLLGDISGFNFQIYVMAFKEDFIKNTN